MTTAIAIKEKAETIKPKVIPTVSIHGKEYVTVATRVNLAQEDKAFDKLYTEVLNNDPIVIRATVTIKGKDYTGISSVSLQSAKMIEKSNPYEVAETSAVGRALGFAGYGAIDSIASADEMHKSSYVAAPQLARDTFDDSTPTVDVATKKIICDTCGEPAADKQGVAQTGRKWHGIFCSTGDKSHTRWLKD